MTLFFQFGPLQRLFQDALRCLQTGEVHAAIVGFNTVIQEDPQHARAWHFLGVAYLQMGEAQQAAYAIRQAISLDERKSAFHNNLGVSLLAQGWLEDARGAFANAVSLDCRYADAIANLALVESQLGHLAEAHRLFRDALGIQPRHVDALFNLANLLADEGKPVDAAALYQAALEVQPCRGDILNNLGRAFLDQGDLTAAGETFAQARAVDPRRGEAAFNAGKVFVRQERHQEANDAFTAAARLRPDKSLWRLQELGLCPTVFQSIADLDEYRADLERRLDEALQIPMRVDIDELAWDGFVPPFNLAHHGRSNRRLLEKFAALFTPHIPKRSPEFGKGKRRVGFVVTAPHAANFLRTQAGIVEHLDPKQFDVAVCCADSMLAKLRAGIRRDDVQWVPFGRRFTSAANTIAAAACDLLYFHKVSADPLGYLLPFARLAPVQCTGWLTHFTSGVPEVDFYLSSSLVEAPQADQEYTEKLVRLDTLPFFERRPLAFAPVTRSDFGLPAQGSLYLCPQRLGKFHPDQDELFRQILDADSTGVMVLLAGNGETVLGQLLSRFRRTLGTAAAARIVVLPRQSATGLRQLMSVCDTLLDIHHYGVSLMAYDAFAAGLPIVSLPGQLKVERYALGFYRMMEIPDLVAEACEEYVRLAVRMGKDADFRDTIKQRIEAVRHRLFEDAQSVQQFQQFTASACVRR